MANLKMEYVILWLIFFHQVYFPILFLLHNTYLLMKVKLSISCLQELSQWAEFVPFAPGFSAHLPWSRQAQAVQKHPYFRNLSQVDSISHIHIHNCFKKV